jgi:hypothetical protein
VIEFRLLNNWEQARRKSDMLVGSTKARVAEVEKWLEMGQGLVQDRRRPNGPFGFGCYDGPEGQDRSAVWNFNNGWRVLD